jgi:hypothetical protein
MGSRQVYVTILDRVQSGNKPCHPLGTPRYMAGGNLKSFKYSLRAVPVEPNGPFLRRIFLSVRGLWEFN